MPDRRHYLTIGTLLLTMGLAAPVGAQVRQRYPSADTQWEQRAYQAGYSAGLRDGEQHGRRGTRFDCNGERAFRGYRGGSGDRDDFRRSFVGGYDSGYQQAYYQYAQRAVPRYDPRPEPYGYPNQYPNQYPGRRGGGWGYRGYASQNGFNDGYQAGLSDGRDNDRFDPIGERRYRSGDRGYERRYGSKDAYKAEYRNAFRSGYEQGYRDGRAYRNRRGGRWSPF